jgi:hypothetical protein
MAVTKKTKKDPMIVAIEKKSGRPAGTRTKRVPTVESVRNEWSKRYNDAVGKYEYLMRNVHANGEILNKRIVQLENIVAYLESKIERLLINAIKQQ